MVKKIGGKGSPKTSGAVPVQPTKTVESSKIGGVDQVKGTDRQSAVDKTSAKSTAISAHNQEQLLQMIDEEAEKLFGADSGLSENKKKTLKGAVKMAIKGGVIEED